MRRLELGRVGALILVGATLTAFEANAQSITDARRAEFTPSTDHNVVDSSSGAALVQRYVLDVFLPGGTTPVSTADLGKPDPGTDGLIRLDFVALLTTPLTPGVVYESAVSAVGPGGSATSARSNTFAFSQPCTPVISPTSQSIAASGGTGSSTLTLAAGCAWTATSNASWITITSGASGSGSGTVAFTIAANATTSSRSGTLTIAGLTFTVSQAGAACSPAISPTSASVVAAGGSGTISVTAATGCAWTASSNRSWLAITSGATGSGNGSVAYTVAPNTSTNSRSGTVTAGGRTFSVTQAAAPCSYTIAPTSGTVPAAGGTGSVSVTTSSGCAWTAASGASWVTISSGSTGSGSGTVSFTAQPNPGTGARTATLTIAGKAFQVSQPGASCTFSPSPTSITAPAAGGPGTITVSTTSGCSWTSSSGVSWITVTGSGSGSGSATYSVAANTGTSSRSGTITVGGVAISVEQAAPPAGPGPPTNLRIVK